MKNKQRTPLRPLPSTQNSGFTIVELLIVIVIIGILAAITIVAYNGIQERARVNAVTSALKQAQKKLSLYQVDNPDQYPAAAGTDGMDNLNTLGITNSGSTSYQYSSSTGTYCLTATTGSTSYKLSNTATTPTQGGCSGHGQGGVAAITNMATNPSFEATMGANGHNATNTWGSGGGASGARFLRSTRNNTSGASGAWWDAAIPNVGQTYQVTLSARGNVTTARDLRIEWINAAGTSQVSSQTLATISPSGSWTTVSGSGVAPTGAGRLRLTLYTQGSSTGTVSDYVDVDNVMITEGATAYPFADGNSTNWIWNGTLNNSTSTGPAS
jgi:prepilin-type N-terminal cleavage/methylation domain-containing protein